VDAILFSAIRHLLASMMRSGILRTIASSIGGAISDCRGEFFFQCSLHPFTGGQVEYRVTISKIIPHNAAHDDDAALSERFKPLA